jgi:phenylalanyl-tRNA synthetase alpha chain
VRWCRGERIVPVADNYDLLGYDPADVTREARYSRYVSAGRMLRSHSTALIPPALRALAAEPAGDVLLVCPALVYRRDTIDRLHTGTPHQLDLWRVTRREPAMTRADLREMIRVLLGALLPGATAGQDNLLVRVVLRDLDRTLTDADANSLRDRIYAAIHQGSAHQWAGASPPPHP